MPIGYLCQWISYAVFAVVSVCCVPVSHVDVLTHSFQLRQNFVLQVFDFYRLILHLYHQISHMAELCHINIKRRFRRYIFFSDKVLQKIFCLCHNTTEQYQYHSQILNKSQCYHHCPVCPASQPTKWILSMDIHSCHIRLIIPLNHTQKFPSISFVKTCMVCNQIDRSNSFGLHILHNNIK